MFTMTDGAKTKFLEITQAENREGHGLRINVNNGGTYQPEFALSFVAPDESRDDDVVSEAGGVKLYADPESAKYLEGASVDFIEEGGQAGFKIDAPNAGFPSRLAPSPRRSTRSSPRRSTPASPATEGTWCWSRSRTKPPTSASEAAARAVEDQDHAEGRRGEGAAAGDPRAEAGPGRDRSRLGSQPVLQVACVRPRTITALAAVVALLAVGTAGAENAREQSITWLLDGLKATPRPCPEKIEFTGYAEGATCAEVEADTKRFRKLLRKTIHRGRSEPSELLEERKSKDGSLYGARTLVKGQLLDLFHESGTGTITLLSPLSCLKDPDGSAPLPAALRPELDSFPVLKHREEPAYPEEARLRRTRGVVAIDGRIDAEGRMTETCVVFVSPAGIGFEEATLSALGEWRFTPAMLDGDPEPVVFRTVMTFSIMSPWLD